MAQHRKSLVGIERVRPFLYSESVVADDISPPQPLWRKSALANRKLERLHRSLDLHCTELSSATSTVRLLVRVGELWRALSPAVL